MAGNPMIWLLLLGIAGVLAHAGIVAAIDYFESRKDP
jgi:hypothetical protein